MGSPHNYTYTHMYIPYIWDDCVWVCSMNIVHVHTYTKKHVHHILSVWICIYIWVYINSYLNVVVSVCAYIYGIFLNFIPTFAFACSTDNKRERESEREFVSTLSVGYSIICAFYRRHHQKYGWQVHFVKCGKCSWVYFHYYYYTYFSSI